jgi:hypothetical protein
MNAPGKISEAWRNQQYVGFSSKVIAVIMKTLPSKVALKLGAIAVNNMSAE